MGGYWGTRFYIYRSNSGEKEQLASLINQERGCLRLIKYKLKCTFDSISWLRRLNSKRPEIVKNPNQDTVQWDQVKENFAVQVIDGNIGIYLADSEGVKGDLVIEVNDERIVKSELNTLTVSGFIYNDHEGTGTVRVRGVCRN